jgi:hypothetical protein
MKFYIAAKSQDRAAQLRQVLLTHGHTVVSRWITEDTKFAHAPGAYTDQERQAIAA